MNSIPLLFTFIYYGCLTAGLILSFMALYEYIQIRKKRKDDKK